MRYVVKIAGFAGMPAEELVRCRWWWSAMLRAEFFNAMNSPHLFAFVEEAK